MTLLSQQCWCWGQDILRPEGNWLLELGFDKFAPPEKYSDRGSIYQLSLPGDRLIILRGFGVLFGQAESGGIFLPRFQFTPRHATDWPPESPPWTSNELPEFNCSDVNQHEQCTRLTLELLHWIHGYEVEVAERLGVAYRRGTLDEWDDGERDVISAECLAAEWLKLSAQVAESMGSILPLKSVA